MNLDSVIAVGQQAMLITLLVSAPMLLSGLLVGLVIGILQSVTQIQEITLTFVPKIVVVLLSFLIFLPWMTDVLITYFQDVFRGMSQVVR